MGQPDGSRAERSAGKTREVLRASKRKSEGDLLSEMADIGATPTKTACQSAAIRGQSPSQSLKSGRSRSNVRQQSHTSNSNLAAITKSADADQQQRTRADRVTLPDKPTELAAGRNDPAGVYQDTTSKTNKKTAEQGTGHKKPAVAHQDTTTKMLEITPSCIRSLAVYPRRLWTATSTTSLILS